VLNRAAFGATPGEIAATKAKGLDGAIHDLVEPGDRRIP